MLNPSLYSFACGGSGLPSPLPSEKFKHIVKVPKISLGPPPQKKNLNILMRMKLVVATY